MGSIDMNTSLLYYVTDLFKMWSIVITLIYLQLTAGGLSFTREGNFSRNICFCERGTLFRSPCLGEGGVGTSCWGPVWVWGELGYTLSKSCPWGRERNGYSIRTVHPPSLPHQSWWGKWGWGRVTLSGPYSSSLGQIWSSIICIASQC